MLDTSNGGTFLSKSNEEDYKLIKIITSNTYQCPVSRVIPTPSQKKPVGVHEVTETTPLASQRAQLNQMMKNMITSIVMPATELVKVVTDTSVVACVYCEGAHLFEDCSANPVSVNYVEVENNMKDQPLQDMRLQLNNCQLRIVHKRRQLSSVRDWVQKKKMKKH
ncbi:hypothetical protein KIW84_051987 [Lathyrus oleraceus]|uniref:Uncharacterized protein n=1 Tax=Pisum sativum TaxID=3888 RepID=A0A9D4WP39_PEA|nr:hypothetical protein KIW84_051987 [Pisum sativum]